MTPLRGGVFLTPEQSKRLTIIDNNSRQAVVEAIARHLNLAEHTQRLGFVGGDHRRSLNNTPRDWYRMPFGSGPAK